MIRIIDKKTKIFIRDDFTYDADIEYGLNIEPAQGLHKPKWSGEIFEDEEGIVTVCEGEWVEGATQEEITELTKPQPQEPSDKERIDDLENTILMLLMM